jgi:hypothetical protein
MSTPCSIRSRASDENLMSLAGIVHSSSLSLLSSPVVVSRASDSVAGGSGAAR